MSHSLFFGEFFSFYLSCLLCSWPTPLPTPFTTTTKPPLRVAIIADPQLSDFYSYGQSEGSLSLFLVQSFCDIYMKRAYRALSLSLFPTHTLLLGDLFDGGRLLDEQQWGEHVERLKGIFGKEIPRDNLMVAVGNHDIGLGLKWKQQNRERFEGFFGKMNYIKSLGSIDLVVLDVISPLDKTMQFLNTLPSPLPSRPRILITHIPLYRPSLTYCLGPRTHPDRPPHEGYGVSYQNLLSNSLSSRLVVEEVKPSLVLSGDDHDYCRLLHEFLRGGRRRRRGKRKEEEEVGGEMGEVKVWEETVGTFSWCQGNFYPSFSLLTILEEGEGEKDEGGSLEEGMEWVGEKWGEGRGRGFGSGICFLPPQIAIYISYGVFGGICVLVLLVEGVLGTRKERGGERGGEGVEKQGGKSRLPWMSFTKKGATSIVTTLEKTYYNVSSCFVWFLSIGLGGGGGGEGVVGAVLWMGGQVVWFGVGVFLVFFFVDFLVL